MEDTSCYLDCEPGAPRVAVDDLALAHLAIAWALAQSMADSDPDASEALVSALRVRYTSTYLRAAQTLVDGAEELCADVLADAMEVVP